MNKLEEQPKLDLKNKLEEQQKLDLKNLNDEALRLVGEFKKVRLQAQKDGFLKHLRDTNVSGDVDKYLEFLENIADAKNQNVATMNLLVHNYKQFWNTYKEKYSKWKKQNNI